MIEKRKYPRFHVPANLGLDIRIEDVKTPLFLAQIGQGGCGFFAYPNLALPQPNDQVLCHLEWEGAMQPVTVSALVRYVHASTDPARLDQVYYGLEFSEEAKERMPEILELLHSAQRDNPEIFQTSSLNVRNRA